MFSATWGQETRTLASAVLGEESVHITIGGAELAAAASITQRVEVLKGKRGS